MNATFHSFKENGKWYVTGRGMLTKEVFDVFGAAARREAILQANGGNYPGLSGRGVGLIFVVFGDDDFGYPLLLKPNATGEE
jgi:hypothetical protein